MDAEKLYEAVKKQPFEPVRIFVSDGSSYDVKHPEQLLVTKRWSYIGLGGNGEGPFQDNAVVDNMHVTRIEPLKPRRKTKKR
jgi:hypothetical protein